MHKKRDIGKVTISVKIKRAVWNVVATIFFRPFITKAFRLWRISLLKMFGADIDWSAEVYASAKIWAPWNLKMENGSCFGPDTIVYNQSMVTLKADACISQYAYICTAGHSTKEINNAETSLLVADVTVGKGAWVGTQAFISMGVEIGDNSIVGACACVFKDVPAYTVVGGNPAREIKKRELGY